MIYVLGDKRIQTAGDEYYVAPGACVIGNVRLGIGASVWFNCVLRGDNDWITIGDGCNVQDGSIIHTDDGEPVTLGANVSIGHALVPPGKVIPDGSVVMGMPGKIVRDVSERELALIEETAKHYVARGQLYRRELTLDPRG